MYNKKMFNTKGVAMFIVGILLAFCMLSNVTLAYFTDSASSASTKDNVLTFGKINFEATILDTDGTTAISQVNNGTVTFTVNSTYVASMDDVNYTLKIADTETQPFYFRLAFECTKNGETTTNISLGISSSTNKNSSTYKYVYDSTASTKNWAVGSDNKYYYNGIIDLSTGEQYIPLTLSFASTFGSADFGENDTFKVSITAEAIQSANNGYTGWESADLPTNWPNA